MLFTSEHEQMRDVVRRFVDKEINPNVEAWEEVGQFPAHALLKKMGDLGLLGVTKPATYGGLDLDFSYALVIAEALGGAHCGSIPMAVGVHMEMATPALARYGSDELRQEFLAPAIRGDVVACLGVSEPGAGSDVAAITTRADRRGGDYVINGTKMWITNGRQADWMCLLANTGEGAPHENKSLIILPMKTPGVTVSEPLHKLGMRSSDTAQVFFDDVQVPLRYRIGEEGRGFSMQMEQFQDERLYGAASMLEALEGLIALTLEHCRERRTFGRRLIDNQAIQFRLAELATEVEALRALTYRACEQYVAGENVTRLASMAKLKAGRLARELTDACLQYWGGMGFMWESRVARAYRDLRLVSIGAGADEIMLGIISKLMGMHAAS